MIEELPTFGVKARIARGAANSFSYLDQIDGGAYEHVLAVPRCIHADLLRLSASTCCIMCQPHSRSFHEFEPDRRTVTTTMKILAMSAYGCSFSELRTVFSKMLTFNTATLLTVRRLSFHLMGPSSRNEQLRNFASLLIDVTKDNVYKPQASLLFIVTQICP